MWLFCLAHWAFLELLFSQIFLSFSSLLLLPPSLSFAAICGILVTQPGIEPVSPAVETWNPNYCTAAEVPSYLNELSFQLCFMLLSCVFHFLLNRDEEARKELWEQSFFLARSVAYTYPNTHLRQNLNGGAISILKIIHASLSKEPLRKKEILCPFLYNLNTSQSFVSSNISLKGWNNTTPKFSEYEICKLESVVSNIGHHSTETIHLRNQGHRWKIK